MADSSIPLVCLYCGLPHYQSGVDTNIQPEIERAIYENLLLGLNKDLVLATHDSCPLLPHLLMFLGSLHRKQ